jgi:hypothetical protein
MFLISVIFNSLTIAFRLRMKIKIIISKPENP